MTKNRMMRTAAYLLVAVLLTATVISGTLAKYTTKASLKDSARVAKFGIEVVATGDNCFSKEYTSSNGVTVKSSNEDKLVAPGTSNTSAATFKITGSSETMVNVEFSLGSSKDVFLKGGEGVKYLDYTTGDDTTDTFDLAATYYPVKFSLKQEFGAGCWPIVNCSDDTNGIKVVAWNNNGKTAETKVTSENKDSYIANGFTYGGYVEITGKSLSEINTLLSTVSGSMSNLNPNYQFNDTFTLSWAWTFDGVNDKADTALGQIAAGNYTGLTKDTDYCLDQAYDFSITVTQVD